MLYAEAMNEAYGPNDAADLGWTALEALNKVRTRAGITVPYTTTSQTEMTKKIRNERRVELAFLDQRYFDLRRWKDAKDEESLPMYGCNVFMTKGERDLFYKPVPVSDVLTCFAEKTYFWPIDRSEFEKNVRLTQNPGWQSEK